MKIIVFIMVFIYPDRPLEMEYAFVKQCPSAEKVEQYLSQHPARNEAMAIQPACQMIDLGNAL